ncbi:MAG TPA: histone deacetylase [Elusimicrobia bacterium]|nr:histone deacetylase [Elusimicrobiota bacterium]
MEQMKIVFSKKYTVRNRNHVFRSDKFEETLKTLLREKIISRKDIVEAPEPLREDLRLVHSAQWVDKNLSCRFIAKDCARAELEITSDVALAHLMNVGGTIKAAEIALSEGLGVNCGGGAHHAFAGHGEGFCLLNDIAVAIKKLLKAKKIRRAIVIDLDAHQGNGTASILKKDKRVFTFSMHNKKIYPEKKEKSSLDIELRPGTGDGIYLGLLKKNLPTALEAAEADLAVYVAGADVYSGDLLGGLKLTMGGIKKRDAFVFAECFRRKLPVVVVLSGGYAKKFKETVRIHANTITAAHSEYEENHRGLANFY